MQENFNAEPVFIIGNPRSGTTVFRMMLNANDDLFIPPECGFAAWLYAKYADWNGGEEQLNAFLADLESARKFETWHVDIAELKAYINEKHPETYSEVVFLVYDFYAVKRGIEYKLWGDKNNFYLDYIDTIDKMYPKSKFLYIVRDGRDVACSYIELYNKNLSSKYAPKLPNQIDVIAKEWADNNKKILDSFAKLGSDRVFSLRYEDLVIQPESILKNICDFLGLTYSSDMLEFYNKPSFDEPGEFLQWKSKLRMGPNASSMKRYEKSFSEDDLKVFDEQAGDMLKHFGYE